MSRFRSLKLTAAVAAANDYYSSDAKPHCVLA